MEHPRLLLPRFLSDDLCRELIFIHRSCCTLCSRPFVFSTTLSHLIATNHVDRAVEEFFGYEYQLFIEFTGLISWCKGSSIGWHSDDNRPYLKQRHFVDFQGGDFHFQDGEPKTVVPMAGNVLTYTADSRNVYSVDETIAGERSTLTLWFTLDRKHDEDAKRLMLLSSNPLASLAGTPDSYCPLPAPDDMYRFCTDSFSDPWMGLDIRSARISTLGCSLCTRGDDDNTDFITNRTDDSPLKLDKPLLLGRGDGVFKIEFSNSLHALQVLQFYSWNVSGRREEERVGVMNVENSALKLVTRKLGFDFISSVDDLNLAESFLGYCSGIKNEALVDLANFSAAFVLWEHHVQNLQ